MADADWCVLQSAFNVDSGWTATGTFDVSITLVMGDKDVATDVRIGGILAKDSVNITVSESVTGAVRFGAMAAKDNFASFADVGYAGSGDTKPFTFGLKVRYAF